MGDINITRRRTIGTVCDELAKQSRASQKVIRKAVARKPALAKPKTKSNPRTERLAQFVERVTKAARKVRRRFGDDQVYIVDAWEASPGTLSLEEFKKRLLEAYQADLVDLGKADMPQALPPDLVKPSRIRGRSVDFVFIRV